MEIRFHNLLGGIQLLYPNEKYFFLPDSGYLIISNLLCKKFLLNHELCENTSSREIKIEFKDESLELVIENKTYFLINLSEDLPVETVYLYKSFFTALNKLEDTKGNVYYKDLIYAFDENNENSLELCSCNKHIDKVLKYTNNVKDVLFYIKYMPHIFLRPKLHLKQNEEIRPASLVTRIGPEAIRHLASHSEHWKGINASGLVPERLLARTLEDDYAIYENVAVKTLINKVYILEKKNKEYLIDCMMNFSFEDSYAQGKELEKIIKAIHFLLKGYEKNTISTFQQNIDEKYQLVLKILNYINKCKETELYRKLSKCKDISGKLKNTNIFMMDNYYKKAYSLWQLLENKETEENSLEKIKIDTEYFLYVQVLLIFTIQVIGFEPLDKDEPIIKNGMLRNIAFKFKNWLINLNTDKARLFGGFISLELSKVPNIKIPFNIFLPDSEIYSKFGIEKKGNTLIFSQKFTNEQQQNLVKELSLLVDRKIVKDWTNSFKSILFDEMNKTDIIKSKIIFVPWKYGVPDNHDLAQKLIQKLSSFMPKGFDEYYILTITRPNELKNIKDEELLKSFLTYSLRNKSKTNLNNNFGILPICSNDINSFRRFYKIIMKNMILVENDFTYCPQCGAKLRGDFINGYSCINCKLEIRNTHCPKCNNDYINTVYPLPKVFALDTDIPGMKLLLNENKLGFKDITPMGNIANIEDKYQPLCPYCNPSSLKLDFSKNINLNTYLIDTPLKNQNRKPQRPVIIKNIEQKQKVIKTSCIQKIGTEPKEIKNHSENNKDTIKKNETKIVVTQKGEKKFKHITTLFSRTPLDKSPFMILTCVLCGKKLIPYNRNEALIHMKRYHKDAIDSGYYVIMKKGKAYCAKCGAKLDNLMNVEFCDHINKDCSGKQH